MLVVGKRGTLAGRCALPPVVDGMTFADIADLTPALLARLAPDVVLSPLVIGHQDATDLADLLLQAGFRGRYRVVVGALPHPALVLADLRAAAPGLDIDLFPLPHR